MKLQLVTIHHLECIKAKWKDRFMSDSFSFVYLENQWDFVPTKFSKHPVDFNVFEWDNIGLCNTPKEKYLLLSSGNYLFVYIFVVVSSMCFMRAYNL